MMIIDEGGHGRNVYGVRIVCRVLEESVVRVEQLPGEQEEELSARSAVVQALLAVPQHAQLALLKLFLAARHDASEGVFEKVLAPNVESERIVHWYQLFVCGKGMFYIVVES